MNNLIPDIYCNSINDINFEILKSKGFRAIALDIDNTLMPHGSRKPDQDTFKFIEKVREMGFELCIVSNASGDRAVRFAEHLGIPVVRKAKKPSVAGFLRATEIMGSKADETIMIGDQLFTDILGGNRSGMLTILVNRISKKEIWTIRLKRIFELPFLWEIRRRGKTI